MVKRITELNNKYDTEKFSRKTVTPTENKLYILSCSLSAQTSNLIMEKLKRAFAHRLIQFAYVCCSTF